MSIESQIVVTLAEVEVDDDYQITLTTRRKITSLDWAQTEQLIEELIEAVESAKFKMSEDFPRTHPAGIVHGFDQIGPESVQTVEVPQPPADEDSSRVRGAGGLPEQESGVS